MIKKPPCQNLEEGMNPVCRLYRWVTRKAILAFATGVWVAWGKFSVPLAHCLETDSVMLVGEWWG